MGNRIAVNNLGVCLQFGRGIPKDEVAAVACYSKAMKQGSILAQNNLSMCYLRGVGVDMDEEKAIALYVAVSFCLRPRTSVSASLLCGVLFNACV